MSAPRVALVDAFTRTPGEGNRAGVVADAGALDEAAMLRIAKGVAASETAFVLPAPAGADIRLRYFTPATEVPFCGHATVATAHRLAETGRLVAPARYVVDCRAGRIELELERAGEGCRVWVTTPQYPWTESPISEPELMRLLGGSVAMRDTALPVLRAGPKLFVPLSRRADLWSLSPRWDELATTGRPHGVLGFFAFTRDVVEPGHVAHGRFFAPAQGIREDPVTGAANGPLADYLARQRVIRLPAEGGTVRVRAEQGDAMGKPGRVDLEIAGSPERIERVRIGGVAVTVFEGVWLA